MVTAACFGSGTRLTWVTSRQSCVRALTSPKHVQATARMRGTLRAGATADVVVFDAEAHWVVDPSLFRSKSRNSPFVGRQLVGRVERTIVGGATVFRR